MAATYLQQVFSLAGLVPSNDVAANATISAAPTVTATAAAAMPADLSGLLTILLSFSGLREWLKIFLLGGFFETCRRLFSWLYMKFVEKMYITAYFEEDDSSYDWLMAWLSKQPSWADSRDIQVTTETYGTAGTAVLVDDSSDSGLMKKTKRLTYLPSLSRTYTMWYKRRWMTITRTQEQTGWYGNKERTLHISIMARSNKILIELLSEARNTFLAAQEHSMCVYVSDINNNWRHVACRKKRALRSVVLDPGVKDLLLEDARDFLASKEWYAERGIPFRRGYLLYGEPGCGKTSLIHCLAGELNLDVYVISLSRAGLDDSALDTLVNDLPERCLALMEDVDAAFSNVLNRDAPPPSESQGKDANGNNNGPPQAMKAPPPTSKVTLSGLLNALDGVSAQEGRILVATTNKYTSLDPALCRPGRMDLHIEFKLASKYQIRELFSRFYLPGDTFIVGDKIEEEEDEKESVDDSGYASSVETEGPKAEVKDSRLQAETPTVIGAQHKGRGPTLSRRQVHTLAMQFADTMPDRELSMAALQGYLMTYKTRPYEAVKDASAWVIKQRTEKQEKARKEKEAKEKLEREEKEKEEKDKKEKEEKDKKEKEEKDKKDKEATTEK